jgi:Zn-dependent M16 (insulinase) family peptidase
MTTVGSEGFLNMLPVYLDHVLFPTLTQSGYVTEVHHINAEGEDAGVVYCEMQGRENSGESRVHLEMLR